jgi:hypothetical protein
MSVAAGGAFQAPLARFLAARIPGARDIAVEVSAEAGKAGFSAETVMFGRWCCGGKFSGMI